MAGLILKAPFYSPKTRTPNGKSRSGYINYVATREGVEILRSGMAGYVGGRKGSNGLFTDEGETIVMSKIAEEIDSHPGNMWGLILSLKREDAERLGYNSAEQWMNLLRSHRNDIAKEMHIAPENLRWYAAYHDKEEHPHAHMLVWSANPHEPYLSRDGIHNIKKVLAGDIFRQDLLSVYQKQTTYRDDLRREYRERIKKIGEEIREKSFDSPELERLFLELAARLNLHKGKKVYGYLDRKTKSIVNEIVKRIAEDESISAMYDLWYKSLCEIHKTYTDRMPEKIPLWENEEFKPIRNAVVQAASDFDLPIDEDALDYDEPTDDVAERYYQRGMDALDNGDTDSTEYYLKTAVEMGNGKAALALYDAYRTNVIEPPNRSTAKHYLYKAADLGNATAEYILGRDLLSKNPGKAREYLQSSADKDNAQSMYLLGKILLDDGKTAEALRYLEASAERDWRCQTRLGLLYCYKLNDRARGLYHLKEAAEGGFEPAVKAVEAIEQGRNAYLASCVVQVFCNASRVIEERTDRQRVHYTGVDSKLKREIEQKKRGVSMRM